MNERILIAGAGPVGLTLAIELARYGVQVDIVDRITRREPTSRAVAVWPRTLELLDRAGAAAPLLATGNRVSAANIMVGRQSLARVDFSVVASAHPFALMVPQDRTEAVLAAHLEACGVRPQLGVALTGVAQDAHGVTATFREPSGQSSSQRFDWLVACDGAHSVVRHTLGMAFDGETLDDASVQGDFLLKGYPFPPTEIATYWHEDGVLLFFPLGADRFRVVASVGRAEGDEATPPLPMDRFQQLIDQRGPGGITLTETIWISSFRINERQVRNYREGRIFLAGDAAHVHSPAGGQGMNTGMQDAINLAWKLAMVCHGTGDADRLLHSYDAERRPVGADVIRSAGRLTKIATVEGSVAQHVRNFFAHAFLGLSPVRRAMAAQMTELSTGYPSSTLTVAHSAGGVDAGMRMAPASGERPYGAGDRPLFSLRGDGPDAHRLAERFPALLEPAPRPGPGDGRMQLVRPDGYLATAARPGEAHRIVEYLESIAAR